MGKLKSFFNCFIKSFTSPIYYKDILNASFWFSIKFFIFYFFLYSIISTVFISMTVLQPAQLYINKLPAMLMKAYPQELVVTVKKGEVSTNVQEPYAISISQIEQIFKEESKVLGTKENDIQNILVIDTKAGVEDFPKYKTAVLLTKKQISFINDNNNVESVDLSKIGDLTINRSMVNMLINKISPFLNYVFPVLVVSVFIFVFLFVPSFITTYLIFFATILWILGKIMKFQLSYGKSYQMSLHLVIITTTLFGILDLMRIQHNIQFLQTIILTIISIVILSKLKKVNPEVNQISTSATNGK